MNKLRKHSGVDSDYLEDEKSPQEEAEDKDPICPGVCTSDLPTEQPSTVIE